MTKEIICKNGEIALCDDEDYPLLSRFSWYMIGDAKHGRAYPSCLCYGTSTKRFIPMHQMVMGGVHGTDHIDGNRLNNKKENLRAATYTQNGWNAIKRTRTAGGKIPTSQYKGVSKCTGVGGRIYWRVLIKLTKKGVKPEKFVRLGPFKTETEAAIAYNEEVVKHRGEYARLNEMQSNLRAIV